MITDSHRAPADRKAWSPLLWGGLALLLTLPALAMALGAEGVHWTRSDFVIMGTLLALVGGGIEAARRLLRDRRARTVAMGAIVLLFLFVWAELAVGIVGSPFAGS